MIKLAVFDFDNTLMDGETINFLAKEHGCEEEVSSITKGAMEGIIDFFQSLTKRVSLIKGLQSKKAKKIFQELPLIDGARECIKSLKQQNVKVLVFSGGFLDALFFAKEKLNFDGGFANILHEQNGFLTGLVGGEMMFSDSKGLMLKRMQNILGISCDQTLCVGDGANDISMFIYAGKRVAFCAKEALQKEANIIIDTKDLTQILDHI